MIQFSHVHLKQVGAGQTRCHKVKLQVFVGIGRFCLSLPVAAPVSLPDVFCTDRPSQMYPGPALASPNKVHIFGQHRAVTLEKWIQYVLTFQP